MDIVLRLLLGIPIVLIFGGLATFAMGLLTMVVNGPVILLALALCRLLGLRGTYEGLAIAGAVFVGLGQSLTGFFFGLAVAYFAFL